MTSLRKDEDARLALNQARSTPLSLQDRNLRKKLILAESTQSSHAAVEPVRGRRVSNSALTLGSHESIPVSPLSAKLTKVIPSAPPMPKMNICPMAKPNVGWPCLSNGRVRALPRLTAASLNVSGLASPRAVVSFVALFHLNTRDSRSSQPAHGKNKKGRWGYVTV